MPGVKAAGIVSIQLCLFECRQVESELEFFPHLTFYREFLGSAKHENRNRNEFTDCLWTW